MVTPAAVHERVPIDDAETGSGGRPLDATTRCRMGARFGFDFADVTVHAGRDAARSAAAFNARAYTRGSRIVFGAGEFAPGTRGGDALIAHELAHVVQQARGGGHAAPSRTEAEARRASARVGAGQPVRVQLAAPRGRAQFEFRKKQHLDGIQVIEKENGKLAVVLVEDGVIKQGYSELTPPKGMSMEEAIEQVGIGTVTNDGKPHVDVLLPSSWGPQATDKSASVNIVDQGALQRQRVQREQAQAARELRSEMLHFFRWRDQTQGTALADQHRVNMKTMGFQSLVAYRQKYLTGPDHDAFIDAMKRRRRDDAIRRQMGRQDIEAGFTVGDVKDLHDPAPERPPVMPEVSGRSGTRYSTEAETGLRFSKKLKHDGETYGYYQRWQVYVPGKGLQLREVYLDLNGKITRKSDRKIQATHESIASLAIGVIPVVGDAVELGELIYIASTGKDMWGNAVSDAEFFARVGLFAVPGAVSAALARKAAAKELAAQGGKAIADEAEFLAMQAKARRAREPGAATGKEVPPLHQQAKPPAVDPAVPAAKAAPRPAKSVTNDAAGPSAFRVPEPMPEPLAFRYPTRNRYGVALDQATNTRKSAGAAAEGFAKKAEPLPARARKSAPDHGDAASADVAEIDFDVAIGKVESRIGQLQARQRQLRGGDIELPTGHPDWLEVQALESRIKELRQEVRTLELRSMGLPADKAKRWALHEQVVTSQLRKKHGLDKVAVQPRLLVVLSNGRQVEIRPDNLIRVQGRRFRIADAKWTDRGDLGKSGIAKSLNANQPETYPPLAAGDIESVSFIHTEDARKFSLMADEPILIDSRIEIYTNRPDGSVVVLFLD